MLASILDHLIPLIAAALAVVVPFLARKWLSVLSDKMGLEITKQQEEALAQAIQKAILYAEEWARGRIKQGEKPSGADKLEKATAFVEAEIERLGLDELAKEKVSALIEAYLGLSRKDAPPPAVEPKKIAAKK